MSPPGETLSTMTDEPTAGMPASRPIILTAGDEPFPVVFEMMADTRDP
jgi:hypothetical protein